MKKSKNQKRLLLKNRKIPFFWIIINDRKEAMNVMNWLTGKHDVIDKK